MDKKEIQQALVEAIEDDAEFILTNFKYHGNTSDVIGIINDKVSEYCIIETKEDLAAELAGYYRMGKFTLKKHDQLQKGKGIPNFFYLVIAGEKVAFPVPEYCGIILYGRKRGLTVFREATDLHQGYIPPSTYKLVAKHYKALYEAVNAK